jgi:hypothetical protein
MIEFRLIAFKVEKDNIKRRERESFRKRKRERETECNNKYSSRERVAF